MTSDSQPGLRPLIRRRWRTMSLTAAAILVGGAAVFWNLPDRYEATAKLLVMRLDQRLGGVKAANDSIPELTGWSRPLYTQAEVLRSVPILEEVIARLGLRDGRGEPLAADDLAERLSIVPIKDTDVIAVTGKAGTAPESQRIVATLLSAYQRKTADFRRSGVAEALKLIDEQLEAARSHVDAAEAKLLAFRRASGAVDLPEQVRRHVFSLADLDQEVQARAADLGRSRARAATLRKQLGMNPADAMAALALEQNSQVRSLREQLLALQTSPVLAEGLSPEHPQLVAHARRVQSVQNSLRAALRAHVGHSAALTPLDEVRRGLVAGLFAAESEAEAAAAALRVAESGRSALRLQISRYPDLELKAARLEREVGVSGEVYRELLRKREEARVNLSIAPHFAKVIQPPALPAKPVAPLKGQSAPVLGLLAVAGAFVAGLLREGADRTVWTEDLPEQHPDLRVLATVPRLPGHELRRGELVASRDTAPHFTEAIRGLCLALEDELPPNGGRVVALTSATPAEGKSVTLANLALCLAEAGHRVLLVDADRHRPRIHSFFEIPEQRPGLTEILQGQIAPEAGVHAAGAIHVVPAGGRRGGVRISRLRQRLGPAIEAWRAQFDFVLIDLPPLVMFAEVAHVVRHADGVLLLAAIGRINADTLSAAVAQVRSLRKPVIGLVALARMGYGTRKRYLDAAPSEGRKS